MKILVGCRAGLVRSVSLTDVLKLHFEPVDVLAVGLDLNSEETKQMLFDWAEKIIVMEDHFRSKVPSNKEVFVCEVGPDTYGSPKNPELIDKVFRWARNNQSLLEIKEHNRII